jgi:hypothetical protein
MAGKICGYTIWPYTENNICVDEPDHEGKHKDRRGREFDHGGYIKTPRGGEAAGPDTSRTGPYG